MSEVELEGLMRLTAVTRKLAEDLERIAAETARLVAEVTELQDEVMVLRHRLTERGRDNDERFAYIYRQLGLRVTRLP